MKKVLIAVDYNPNSEKVAEAGYQLAKQMQAEICMIHVISDVRYYGMQYPNFMGYEGYDQMVIDLNMAGQMAKVAEDFLQKTKEHFNDPNLSTHMAEGDTAEAILNYASQWHADILVLGTHSHSALEKLFVGDVASDILKSAEIPLYIIPIRE